MNLLDYIIIIGMIYLIVKGIMLGFIREICSLAGIVLGIFLAIVKGVIIIYLIIIILTFYIFPSEPLMAESKLSPWVIRSYQNMIRVISPDSYQNLKKKIIGERKKTGEIKSGENK